MVALKGDKQIGYKINKIIGKLGGGKEMQRIVAKIRELMSLCDRLETEITIRKHKAAFLSKLSFT